MISDQSEYNESNGILYCVVCIMGVDNVYKGEPVKDQRKISLMSETLEEQAAKKANDSEKQQRVAQNQATAIALRETEHAHSSKEGEKKLDSYLATLEGGDKNVDKKNYTPEQLEAIAAKEKEIENKEKQMEDLMKSGQKSNDEKKGTNKASQGPRGFLNTASTLGNGFMDQINTFMDSDLMSTLKSFGYMLASFMGNKEDRGEYALEAAYSDATSKLSSSTKNEKVKDLEGNELKDQNGKTMTYLQGIRKITSFPTADNRKFMTDFKNHFMSAPLENQKLYIATVLTDPSKKFKDEFLSILGKKIEKPAVSYEAQNNNPEIVETPNAKNIIKVKGLEKDPNQETSLEIQGEGDNQYINYNNTLIPLINNQAKIYLPNIDEKTLREKTLTFAKDKDGKNSVDIKDGKKDLPLKVDIAKDFADNEKFNIWQNKILSEISSLASQDRKGEADQAIISMINTMRKENPRTVQGIQTSLTNLKEKLLTMVPPNDKNKLDIFTIS